MTVRTRGPRIGRHLLLLLWGVFATSAGAVRGDDAPALRIDSPRSHQVVQRAGAAPGTGYAHVEVVGEVTAEVPNLSKSAWRYRVVLLGDGGAASAPAAETPWSPLAVRIVDGKQLHAQARVAAGGWYRLEVQAIADGQPLVSASAGPFGVGEVFVVAGQSYATNCNDERQRVADSRERVAAFDVARGEWRVAHDPQPAPDGSDGGSIWPALGDSLVRELQVPVGFANVAVGATSSAQWLPGGPLHARLAEVGKSLRDFRAVLWQQGESDVIAKSTTDTYVANVLLIRDTAATAWGYERPWLLAKSTHHPTVYDDPAGEERIRQGIDQLSRRPGFQAGPDTDTLKGEHRGGPKSRRHFSAIGQRRAAELWLAAIRRDLLPPPLPRQELRIGLAEVDITPPVGFPMAGYYHERLAEGALDSLRAKALVIRDDHTAAALVVCDLIGVATDLSRHVRQRAAELTGIPASNIVLAATHSHTAPDYMKELYLYLGKEPQEAARAAYVERLLNGPVEAIVKANAAARPALIESGVAVQTTPVSFHRRFVMRDGSVRTWQNYENPEVVRAAGPIDTQIGLVAIRDPQGAPRGVLSNFALHLDTVGGTRWSADYPHFLAETLRGSLGPDIVSIFATGCCGDINHADPRRRERNKADFIGGSLGTSITQQLPRLRALERPALQVRSRTIRLPLQDAAPEAVTRSVSLLAAAARKEKIDFFDHVAAYKTVMLDQFRRREPTVKTVDHLTWGLSRSLAGIGAELPVDVTVMALGPDVAIVALPGEVFVELGLAIKQGSPFRTTLVVELANHVETIYVPHRAAYAGGGYEVTNSAVQPGSGEILVETALALLREAATIAKP